MPHFATPATGCLELKPGLCMMKGANNGPGGAVVLTTRLGYCKPHLCAWPPGRLAGRGKGRRGWLGIAEWVCGGPMQGHPPMSR